jgi:SlyX protein
VLRAWENRHFVTVLRHSPGLSEVTAAAAEASISPVWLRLSVHRAARARAARNGYTGEMNSDAIERIEIKIAFLERANLELSDVVYRQQREIQELRSRVDALKQQVLAVQTSETAARTPEEERPPHY